MNFAFAYIDPKTYNIAVMESDMPSSLFTQTAGLRTLNSDADDVEIFVSVGGWSFSDNSTATQPVFSDIAAREANRNTFAKNLVNFLKEYGFDGSKCVVFNFPTSAFHLSPFTFHHLRCVSTRLSIQGSQ